MEPAILIILLLSGGALAAIGLGGDGEGDGSSMAEDPPVDPTVNQVEGTDGRDTLEGTTGRDNFLGGDGRDVISGFEGDDTLNGGAGFDFLFGGEGNDSLESGPGGPAASLLYGGSGSDTLTGGDDRDALYAGGYEDYEEYRDSGFFPRGFTAIDTDADVLDGGGGDDQIFFSGNDTATGGTGADTFHIDNIDEIIASGLPAVVADFDKSAGETIRLNARDVTPTILISGDDAIIQLDGDDIVVVQNGAATLEEDDILLEEF